MRKRLTAAAAIIMAAAMIADRADASQPSFETMQIVCSAFNDAAKGLAGATGDCVPYSDGIWLTLQGNWPENETQQEVDKRCNDLLMDSMRKVDLDSFTIRITEIDNHERQTLSYCHADAADAPAAPSAAFEASSAVVATYRDGSYSVTGIVNGFPTPFLVDTGATHTVLNVGLAVALGFGSTILPVGSVKVIMADGVARGRAVYLVDHLCVSGMCAENLLVTLEDADSLLGADFLKTAHVSLAIKDGVMTLGGN